MKDQYRFYLCRKTVKNVKLMGITEGNTLSFVDDMSTSCKQNKQSTEREKQDEKLHGV